MKKVGIYIKILIALTIFSAISLSLSDRVVAQELVVPASDEQTVLIEGENLEPDELSELVEPIVQDELIEPAEEDGQIIQEEPVESGVVTDGNVRVVKVQLKDTNWLCADYAEFFVLENLDTKTIDLTNWKVEWKTGAYVIEAAKEIILAPGENIIFYNLYLTGSKASTKCPANYNLAASEWLNQLTYSHQIATTQLDTLPQTGFVKISNENGLVDEVDLTKFSYADKEDTVSAQTLGGELLLDEAGKPIMRSVNAVIDGVRIVGYEDFLVYEPPILPNLCLSIKISEIGANLPNDQQFIELLNTSSSTLDLSGCKLRSLKSSQVFTFEDLELAAGEYRVIFVSETELSLTKTTSDAVLLINEAGEVVDQVTYENLKAETSYALIDDTFLQTFQTTPGGSNIYQKYPPCNDGYERNLATGYCRKILEVEEEKTCSEGYELNIATNRCRKIVVESAPAPCPTGSYRNPETGRCNQVKVLASVYAPCPVGYERNPETNRCRKINNQQECEAGYEVGFTGTCVKVCEQGYERNSETNRCRKILDEPKMASAMEVRKIIDEVESEKAQITIASLWPYALASSVSLAGFLTWDKRLEIATWLRNR